ncbi:MAG: acetyl-CoA carboxylase biotin carboxyl carrier protein [Alphaproteobacteria bacterium]|nr:acetyl-CoA carboxylase biotin carboxyl carrier protein [Alphaproteobacteria bacterium]
MPDKFVVDGESVRGLANLLEETGLTEIEYQVGTQRIRVVRTGVPAVAPHYAPQPSSSVSSESKTPIILEPTSVEPPAPQGEAIPSPMVGTVYLSGEPGSVPFVKVGDFVRKGDTLLIVEAMKVMNPIRAPRDGKVLEVCVQDTKPVEFGEPLIILE